MNNTPTAEEVLGLYQKAQSKDGTNDDYLAFHRALRVWREGQGPVTREWFAERFGRYDMFLSVGWLKIDGDGDVLLDGVILDNPTRSKIEALVEMLGGTDAS